MSGFIKKIALFIPLLIAFLSATACDICGCGIGNNYIGILPNFKKTIVGIRYRHNTMTTHVGVGGSVSYLTTYEKYKVAEIWSGWTVSNKFRILLSLPYNFSEKTNQGTTHNKNGLGDINATGLYQVLGKKATATDQAIVQSLWMGAGVKLATGKYNPADKSGSNNANLFQLGTGSNDFTLNAMYDIQKMNAGINISAAYKINTANKYDYKYGNKINISSQLYYAFAIGNKLIVSPNAGVQFEAAAMDKDNSTEVSVSGGNILQGTAGIEIGFGKISLGANLQTPLSQNLAKGIVHAGNRNMIHVSIPL